MKIFITGVTGFLGGELLVLLSRRTDVEKIFCLIRANSDEEASERLNKVFRVHDDTYDKNKIIAIRGDLASEGLAQQLIQNKILNETDVILHSAANTSFSKIYDDLIERVNIKGLREILTWSKSLPDLKTFVYVGTATICGKNIKNKIIFEEDSPNPNAEHLVKYTYSKMMGEIMLHEYLPEEKILIVRPSIIMGDSRLWIPRSYVILWALATANLLRLLPMNPDAPIDIISVDFAANSIVSILFAKRNHRVYHISSGITSATTPDKLTASISKFFPDKPVFKFLNKRMINEMKLWAKGKLSESSPLLQNEEHLNYWKDIFEDKGQLRILFSGFESYIDFVELGHIFDNSKLLADLDIEAPEPAHKYLEKTAGYIENINVYDGALDP
jgi:thioester reductase-like protein